MATLIAYLAKIPNAIWHILLGSALSMFGAWLANQHSKSLQVAQLNHDSLEKQRDRQTQMRREVYLAAAESIANMTASFGQMANMKVSIEEHEQEFLKFSASVIRMQIVSNESALLAISAIYREYSKTFAVLLRDKLSLYLKQTDIDIAEKQLSVFFKEGQRCIEIMKAYNLDGTRDSKKWEAIKAQSDFATQQSDELMTELSQLREGQLQAILSFSK